MPCCSRLDRFRPEFETPLYVTNVPQAQNSRSPAPGGLRLAPPHSVGVGSIGRRSFIAVRATPGMPFHRAGGAASSFPGRPEGFPKEYANRPASTRAFRRSDEDEDR